MAHTPRGCRASERHPRQPHQTTRFASVWAKSSPSPPAGPACSSIAPQRKARSFGPTPSARQCRAAVSLTPIGGGASADLARRIACRASRLALGRWSAGERHGGAVLARPAGAAGAPP